MTAYFSPPRNYVCGTTKTKEAVAGRVRATRSSAERQSGAAAHRSHQGPPPFMKSSGDMARHPARGNDDKVADGGRDA
ncbi:hypothetical protein MRX96_029331 [Rhipicephalus microplus]